MKNKRLHNDFLISIPFLFWFQAAIIIFSTLISVLYFSASQIFIYLFSLITAVLLIASGAMLRIKKSTAIVYCWIFIVSYFLLLATSPVVRLSNYFILILNLFIIIYISFFEKE